MSDQKDKIAYTYAPNFDAPFLEAKEGVELVQKILILLEPYNPNSARNALCLALSAVHHILRGDKAFGYSLTQLIEMHQTYKEGVDYDIIQFPKLGSENH